MVILVAALSALPVLPAPLLSIPLPLQQESWDQIRAKITVDQIHPRDPVDDALARRVDDTYLRAHSFAPSEDLAAVVEALADSSKIPMRVTEEAVDRANDEGFSFAAEWSEPASLRWSLDLLCRDVNHAITWSVKGGKVVVSTHEERLAKPLLHLHPVKDLLEYAEIDDLAYLIRDSCAPYLWDLDGCALEPGGDNFLAVTHQRDVHLKVESMLAETRAFYRSREGAPKFELPKALQDGLAETRRLRELPVTTSLTIDEGTCTEWLADIAQIAGLNYHITSNLRQELNLADTIPMGSIRQMPLGRVLRDLEISLDARATLLPGWIILHTEGESFEPRAHMSFDVWDIVSPSLHSDGGILFPAQLEEQISNLVLPDSWDNDPNNMVRIGEDGVLTVSQTAEAMDELCELLKKLQKVAIITHGRISRDPLAGR